MVDDKLFEEAVKVGEESASLVVTYGLTLRQLRRAIIKARILISKGHVATASRILGEAIEKMKVEEG